MEMQEATTAEFFSNSATDPKQLRVKFNNKIYPWSQFLKMAQIDSEMQTVLAVMERERRQSGFQGSIEQYILKKYRYYASPNDVTIKDGIDGKKLVTTDADEIERVNAQPVQRKVNII